MLRNCKLALYEKCWENTLEWFKDKADQTDSLDAMEICNFITFYPEEIKTYVLKKYMT